jgi:hypothetical protein
MTLSQQLFVQHKQAVHPIDMASSRRPLPANTARTPHMMRLCAAGVRYFVHSEVVCAKIAAAMITPDTAQRLQMYNKKGISRLNVAPEGNPRPFVIFDGPLYQIKQAKGTSGSQH